MAGGLFGKPFALNIKCIIFSLMIMVIFLYKTRNKERIYFICYIMVYSLLLM